jgi:lipopolysaccharide transport system ATP-binding protein
LLSKRYLVGHLSAKREKYTALRDVVSREARNVVRKTLNVVRGEQVSKVMSWRISGPLKVSISKCSKARPLGSSRGRVASLLEVGTGFHNELTGREKIFLNGAILGMTQREIRKKFDEIVAFAEVERFLDTPVKRYSFGMYVRLAFAVAAHLEPEILVVDEVTHVSSAVL